MYFESDLFLLCKLFFPKSSSFFVLDPGNQTAKNYSSSGFNFVTTREQVNQISKIKKSYVLINLSGAGTFTFPFDFSLIEGIISFNSKIETSNEYFHYLIHYITDHTKRFRWLISEQHRKMEYLADFYSHKMIIDISNMQSLFFSIASYIRIKTGNMKKLTDGSLQVFKRQQNIIDSIPDKDYISFTVNLLNTYNQGTIRAKLYDEKRWKYLYKVAISDKTSLKTEKEYRISSELGKQKYNYLEIPHTTKLGNALFYEINSNVRKTDYFKLQKIIRTRFISTILEYYTQYIQKQTIKEILYRENIIKRLERIQLKIGQNSLPRGLSAINLKKVLSSILKLINSLPFTDNITVSLVNNGLEPDNLYYTKTKIIITNWEETEFDYPVLYDVFEYVFKHIESMECTDSSLLKGDIFHLKDMNILQDFIENNKIKFDIHLKMFLILRLTLEIEKLLVKNVLLPEVNIKIFVWLDFIESYNFNNY